MRLPLLSPDALSAEQKPLYDSMRKGIQQYFTGFESVGPGGELMGPWNPWIHFPAIGAAAWNITMALPKATILSDSVRQIVILVVGVHFNAAYEIYAHVAVAENKDKIAPETIATLVSGSKPAAFDHDEGVAYDLARALCVGGVVPEPVYRLAVETFTEQGAAEIIFLAGLYAMVSMTLNGFNTPVPEANA